MSRTKHLSLSVILNWAVMQIQAMKERPELAAGIPVALALLEAVVAKLNAAKRKQEAVKKSIKLATNEVQQIAFELKGMLNGNRAIVAMVHGPHSPEFVLFGGKPRKGRRSPAGDAAKTVESTPATTTGEAA